MFKSILVFRIAPEWVAPAVATLESVLKKFTFEPCGPTQKSAYGWVSPRGQDFAPMVETVRGQWLLKLQTETKSVPASVLAKEIEKRCKKIEADTGRKPGRKEKKDLKEMVELSLLPRAFSKTGAVLVWIDPDKNLLIVGSSSQRAADDVLAKLVEAFAEAAIAFPLQLVQTNLAPSTAIAQWLLAKEAPAGFTVDRDLELRQPDSEKSAVKYARHNLEIDEVCAHITAGKIPTQVAMTWDSRVSFVLGADMSLKKIDFLESVMESYQGEDVGFDGDALIATSELSRLIPDLLEVLGGEMVASA